MPRLLRAGIGRRRASRLPVPPPEMRTLVGPLEADEYDNPTGALIDDRLAPEDFEAVLDFGCGCGRLARQLIQQRPRPGRYVGIDLHAGMVAWCAEHLAPAARGFEFHHHDVGNVGLNPGEEKPEVLPFPVGDGEMSLVLAVSVFTHLLERQTVQYLRQAARALRAGGVLSATFFLFDKRAFPMMQEFQNALFINPTDPSNAVIYDRAWLRRTAEDAGLILVNARPPEVRGFQWFLIFRPAGPGVEAVEWPEDTAPEGDRRPPLRPEGAERIGLD